MRQQQYNPRMRPQQERSPLDDIQQLLQIYQPFSEDADLQRQMEAQKIAALEQEQMMKSELHPLQLQMLQQQYDFAAPHEASALAYQKAQTQYVGTQAGEMQRQLDAAKIQQEIARMASGVDDWQTSVQQREAGFSPGATPLADMSQELAQQLITNASITDADNPPDVVQGMRLLGVQANAPEAFANWLRASTIRAPHVQKHMAAAVSTQAALAALPNDVLNSPFPGVRDIIFNARSPEDVQKAAEVHKAQLWLQANGPEVDPYFYGQNIIDG